MRAAYISYDLVMESTMSFVEGAYGLHGHEWQAFTFVPSDVETFTVEWVEWDNCSGICIRIPRGTVLDKSIVEEVLSRTLGVDEWNEVSGPDSMALR